MTRARWLPTLIAAGLLVSCGDNLEPPTTGGIALFISFDAPALQQAAVAEGDTAGPADSGAVALKTALFTSARARAEGPTNRSVNLQLVEGFWEGTLDQLAPGTYTVVVEGLENGEVAAMGTTSGINVVAGQQAPATVALVSFMPNVTLGVTSPTTSMSIPVSLSPVQGADGYRVEWANNPAFTSASSRNITETSTIVNVSALATYYVRARAISGTTTGQAGEAKSVEVRDDIPATGGSAAAALNLGFGASVTQRLTQLNIAPATDQDWFSLDACTGDTVFIETHAARLTPPSTLNSYLRLFGAGGVLLLDENDNLDGTTTDSRLEVVLQADERYAVQVTSAAPGSAGEYEISFEVRPGPKNLGNFCQAVKNVVVTPATATIAPGATQQLAAEAFDSAGGAVPGVHFLWVSSNTNVALVDTTGLVRGVGGGTATITALGGGEPGNAVISVTGPPLGQPVQLAFTALPSATVAGEAFSPAVDVEIRDANGNLVPDARDAVTLAIANNPGGSGLFGTKTVNANGGVARFTGLWMDKAAPGYTLTASAAGLSPATSGGFTVAPAAPSKLTFVAQPADVQGNAVFAAPVTVAVTDAFDNVVTTATNQVEMDFGLNVWKSIFSEGSILSGTTTANAVNGVATFGDLKVDKPGPGYRLAATAAGLAPDSSAPFAVRLTVVDHGVAKIGDHTCAVTGTGSVYCWGAGYSGQLGIGSTSSDSVPRPVATTLTFATVEAGTEHTCALTTVPGPAYCWGANYYGQLGNNSTTPSTVPVPVAGGLQFSRLALGQNHTCGLSGTTMYCWGYDGTGALGDDANYADKLVPTPVAGGRQWRHVAVGGYHTCGVENGGTGYCWGYDGYGTLGNDSAYTQQPTPVPVYGGKTWLRMDAGYYFTCGIDSGDKGWCWGANYSGVLGVDTLVAPVGSTQPTPRPVAGGLTWNWIGAGWDNTCGRTSAGVAYCWGNNGYGQLGNGSFTDSPLPVPVAGGLTFDRVYTGGYHACGRVGQTLWCWGAGYSGQLGQGATGTAGTPIQIVQ